MHAFVNVSHSSSLVVVGIVMAKVDLMLLVGNLRAVVIIHAVRTSISSDFRSRLGVAIFVVIAIISVLSVLILTRLSVCNATQYNLKTLVGGPDVSVNRGAQGFLNDKVD